MPRDVTECSQHARLDEYATAKPAQVAFRFLSDGENLENTLDYATLAQKSRSLANVLLNRNAHGKPVILAHPPGSDFIIGLFACWYAGAIAVPAYPAHGSRHRRRLAAIIEDSGAQFMLAADDAPDFPEAIRVTAGINTETSIRFPEVDPSETCLLQYTSGSTASPKGVRISHLNIASHFAGFREFYGTSQPRSIVSWLPPYHDMGLMLKILFAFENAIPLTWFSPEHFIQRPARWLKAISDYQADFSGAPNFAFDLCARVIRDEEIENIDLSCWLYAPCGAERVRPETLEKFNARFAKFGFRKQAFKPGYGLAESTLIATAVGAKQSMIFSKHPKHGILMSSGKPLRGLDVTIVNPNTGSPCRDGEEGEIQLKGPSISSGYWNQPIFPEKCLRTGDLGYFEKGQLFVTGRLKDLLIIQGENVFPDDIEGILIDEFPEISAAAAFAEETGGSETIAIALEVPVSSAFSSLSERIRLALSAHLELNVASIYLTRQGLLPRTTSGKIQRHAVKQAVQDNSLRLLHCDSPGISEAPEIILSELILALTEVTGKSGISAHDDVVSLGMSSIEVTRLAAIMRARCRVTWTHAEIFAARSFRELSDSASYENEALHFQPSEKSESTSFQLTHSQERMWFLHGLAPESAAYHVFGAVELHGSLDEFSLARSYAKLLENHPILRSRHGDHDGKPKVWISSSALPSMEKASARDHAEVSKILTDFATKPFDLEQDSPIRGILIETTPQHRVLALCAHHIVADGWSIRILARELVRSYQNENAAIAKQDYLSFASWHRRWIDSGAVDRQIDYWKNRLQGHSGIMPLTTDFPRPAQPSGAGGAVETTISSDLIERIRKLAAKHRATPFMVQLAAFHLLLRRHGAGDDQVLAVPVANRNHATTGDLIGTLVNTLPFRMQIDPLETFSDFLVRVRDATFEMQAAQDAPFEKIIEAVKPERQRDHSPLAQVMIDHQELPFIEHWNDELRCAPLQVHRGAVQFDLSLLLFTQNERHQTVIEYRSDLFRKETAQKLLHRYVNLLEEITANPSAVIHSLHASTDADKRQLREESYGPSRPQFLSQTTPEKIFARCAKHPERMAVSDLENSLSYGELDEKSSRCAAFLQENGVQPGDRVAILLDRTVDLPVAILAIWKVGAAYVPLDSANPVERLALILEDQADIRVLTSDALLKRLPKSASTLLFEESRHSKSKIVRPIAPEDIAYIIYTSGSTGRPKGVVIQHAALANFLLSMAEAPGFTEGDKLLAVTTVSFDISTLELFLPLVTGGSLEIVDTEAARDGTKLLDRLQKSHATVMQATPATWHLLINAGWSGTPYLKAICGGEALDLSLANKLKTRCHQLWNLYGPTETTVWSTLWQVPESPNSIRIGKPIANTGCHVMEDDGTKLTEGMIGELWISGAGLASGYWNNEALTRKKFVAFTHENGISERAYRTGDLARWQDHGLLECLGRNDQQVKIRGFRVELGEIETAVISHPSVAQAKVALREDRLLCWIVPTSQHVFDMVKLREFLSAKLPSYMIPIAIGVVNTFPLNSSGKVDIRNLPEPEGRALDEAEFPQTSTEIKLAAIWSDLLNIQTIHRNDDWFHIGGHSLLALRLFAGIAQEFKKSLPLSVILERSTLRELAEWIDRAP